MVYEMSVRQSAMDASNGSASSKIAAASAPSDNRLETSCRKSREKTSAARSNVINPKSSVAMAITSFLPRGGENLRRCAAFNVASAA